MVTELFYGHAYPGKNNLVDGIGLTEIEGYNISKTFLDLVCQMQPLMSADYANLSNSQTE